MITIIDYGMGNLGSVEKAFSYLREKVLITDNKNKIKEAESLVLPGVGAFEDAMKNLERLDLIDILKEGIKNKPFLGICLGLQMLFENSEEGSRKIDGLGVFSGEVKKFSNKMNLKIPHVGWNNVKFQRESDLIRGISDLSRFYFVHSYYLHTENKDIVLGRTDYGTTFDTLIESENIIATQFHPEKSGDVGLKFLQNFINFSKKLNGGSV